MFLIYGNLNRHLWPFQIGLLLHFLPERTGFQKEPASRKNRLPERTESEQEPESASKQEASGFY